MKNVNKLAKFRIRYWFLQHQQIITRKTISCKYVFSRWRFSQQLKRCKSLCAFTQQQLLLPHIPIFCSNTTNIHIVAKLYHTHVLNVCVCVPSRNAMILFIEIYDANRVQQLYRMLHSQVYFAWNNIATTSGPTAPPPFSPVCMCMSLSCIDT